MEAKWTLYWSFRNQDHDTSFELIHDFDKADARIEVKEVAGFYDDTLLHIACRNGWLDMVKHLIEKNGCDPEVKDCGKQTPLHYACHYGRLDIVQYLIQEQKCDINAITPDQWTPFYYACRYGHLNVVEYLVGMPGVTSHFDQQAILQLTCEYNHFDILSYLMDEQGFILKKTPKLIHIACKHGNVEIVRFLCSCLDNFQNMDLEEHNALFIFCCSNDLLDILNRLSLESRHPCDLHFTDKFNMSGLHYACQKGHTGLVKYLVEECGCDINVLNGDGLTPLHLACKYGNSVEVVKYLLNRSECNSLMRANDGSTAVHFACTTTQFNPEIVEILVKHGAIVCKRALSLPNDSPRSTNVVKPAILSALLKVTNCDPNMTNYAGVLPVHLATYPFIANETIARHAEMEFYKWMEYSDEKRAITEIQEYIDKNHLDLNKLRASNGDTILHIACVALKVSIVSHLLHYHNFDPNVKNNAGETPLYSALKHYAYKHVISNFETNLDLTNLVSLFKGKLQVWTSFMDDDGNTIMHIACRTSLSKLFERLLIACYRLLFSINNDGYNPLELISNPTIIVDNLLTIGMKYKFKPGSVQHFIWFCKHIDARRLKLFLAVIQHTIEWEHKRASNCCARRFILHVPDHPTFCVLLEICFHGEVISSDTSVSDQYTNCFVTKFVEYLADSSLESYTCNEELLHIACKQNKYNFVQYLLSTAGCDPNYCCNDVTPFYLTTSPDVMQLLIQHGANVQSDDIVKLINILITVGHFSSAVKVLIKESGKWHPDLKCNPKGDTALHLSVRLKDFEATKYLLAQAGCDPNIKNLEEETPLHLATNSDIMQILVQNGAKLKSKDIRKLFRIASKEQPISLKTLKTLMKTKQWYPDSIVCPFIGDTALHLSVRHHTPEVAHFLLSETKCDPNIQNRDGETIMHLLMPTWTSESEIIDIIKDLMATKQWRPNSSCNFEEDTALHLSIKHYKPRVTMFLLFEANCNPNIRNKKEETIIQLMHTWRWSDLECLNIIQLLVKNKCWDPNSSCNSDEDTALHLSMKHYKPRVTMFLLFEANCNPNIRNKKEETVVQLMHTMSWRWSDLECFNIIKLLVKDKCWDPNSSCNSDEDTTLHLSIRHRKPRIITFLLSESKCDPNIKNKKGDSALHELLMASTQWDSSECVVIIKALVVFQQWDPNSSCNTKGDTALHLSVRHHMPEVVHYLLSEARCDPNSKNVDDETPLQLATDNDIINNLIRYGSSPDNVYKLYGKSVKLKKPLKPPVKIFIIGNSSVGKSTLTEALKIEASFLTRAFATRRRVSDVDEKTAGIVPHDFESKNYGRVTFYDFAGHREFYSSHAAFLHNVIQGSSPIFLLVVNLSIKNDIIQQHILYWLSFVENQCSVVNCISHVIVVGSHADVVQSSGDDPQQKAMEISETIKKIFQSSIIKYVGIYPMDCQYPESSGMSKLRNHLIEICNSVRIPETIPFSAHCFHVFLLDKFKTCVAVTVQEIQDQIIKEQNMKKEIARFLPETSTNVCKVCDELNNRGHILFLKNANSAESSWVIIDKARLLSDVTGTIFAPKDFKQHCQLAESTGVVPLSRLTEHFPDIKIEVLIGFMTHLEFCREILDSELLELITKHHESLNIMDMFTSENERYFLFPGLITQQAPDNLWEESHDFKYCGWILQCAGPSQFFSSRFLQVLLLRLAFSFALVKIEVNEAIPAFQRECSIWKNGIFWGEIFGMETIVEIHSSNKTVILQIRCREEHFLHCIAQRSHIIRRILQCVQDFCPQIKTVDSFIHPLGATKFPINLTSEMPRFNVQKIAEAIVKFGDCYPLSVVSARRTILLDDLITFEPYAEIGLSMLRSLHCDQNNLGNKLSNQVLEVLSLKLYRKANLFVEIFKEPRLLSSTPAGEEFLTVFKQWRDGCEGTYKCLKEKLNQYSIFAGRNILVSSHIV